MVAENTEERYRIESILDDPWLKNGGVPLNGPIDRESGNILKE
jgi:hypothetical protein